MLWEDHGEGQGWAAVPGRCGPTGHSQTCAFPQFRLTSDLLYGALKRTSQLMMSGRKAGNVRQDWNGGAEVASPDVD